MKNANGLYGSNLPMSALDQYADYFNRFSENQVPFHDPLVGFNHDLKDLWLSHYNLALHASDYQGAYEHADLVFFQILTQAQFEDWVIKVAQFLIKKPKPQKTQKPETLYFGCQLITLTLPNTITHDEGKKYLADYVSEYFMGKKPELKKKKPKNPIECAWCFEIGESNNLHIHIFTYHPAYKLSTHNSPLKAYKYNANVKTAKTLIEAQNYYDYILKLGKSGSKGEIHPNPVLRQNLKKYFDLKKNEI